MQHLFLTGEIQVGKSTAIRRLLQAHSKWTVGGFRTVAGPVEGNGDGIYLLPANRELPMNGDNLALVRFCDGQERRFTVFSEIFDTVGTSLLETVDGCDLILMDEIGTKEQKALQFQRSVMTRLEGKIPVLGVVQRREGIFLNAVKAHPNVELWTVTVDNREQIYQMLLERYAGLSKAR